MDQGLDERVLGDVAELHVTMSPSSFASGLQEFADSKTSTPQPVFEYMDDYLACKSYAMVPISIQPGSGDNFVHQSYSGAVPNPPDKLCAATAKLLDLQTFLELPLTILGIRLLPERDASGLMSYWWPDKSKVSAIEVVRLTEGSMETGTPLAPADLARTVWDFVQPEKYVSVIVHIRTVSEQPPMSTNKWRPLIDQLSSQGRSKIAAPPRDQSFKDKVKPKQCVVTRSSDLLEASHIISRALRYDLVRQVMSLLFGAIAPRAGTSANPALFHRSQGAIPKNLDDAGNGMFLTPSLHKVFDTRRTIWILRNRCYHLGQPVCYEEFGAFDPPCPSANRMHKIRDDAENRTLWKEQLSHEHQVVPLQCAKLSIEQNGLLHLSALLSFFAHFMKERPAMNAALADIRSGKNKDRTSESDDESGPRKKLKQGETKTDNEEARYESRGSTAAEGSDGVETTAMFSRLTPTNSDDDTETGLKSNLDPESQSEEEWYGDEDEERRQEFLHSDTLALLIMKHSLRSRTALFCA